MEKGDDRGLVRLLLFFSRNPSVEIRLTSPWRQPPAVEIGRLRMSKPPLGVNPSVEIGRLRFLLGKEPIC